MLSEGRRLDATPLNMSVDRSDPATPLIHVGGELAYATASPLQAEVDRIVADAPHAIVLDFADLTFIDSTGLAVIVHTWRAGQEIGAVVRLRSVPRFLETILDITGVATLLGRPLSSTRPRVDTDAEPSTATA